MGSLVAKFGPDGAQQWLHDLPDGARGEAVAVNASGDAYFVGWMVSTNTSWLEKRDVFGNQVWRVELISPENSLRAYGVAVSPNGKVVVTGGVWFGPGDGVAFLATYSALGAEESFRLQPFPFDGEWESQGRDVAVDALGNVYVAGHANRSAAADGRLNYAYVAKYDASGGAVWIDRFTGGGRTDRASGVAANASADRVCATGWVIGELEGQSRIGVFGDAYVVCYDTSGTRLYTRQFGTEEEDYGEGIALDAAGNVYVVGSTDGTFGTDLGGLLGGGTDAFLARYDSQGNQTHIWQFGTPQGDFANGVAVDGSGNVYVTGRTFGRMYTVGPVPGAFLVKVEGF